MSQDDGWNIILMVRMKAAGEQISWYVHHFVMVSIDRAVH
jgi:hypothetical protein